MSFIQRPIENLRHWASFHLHKKRIYDFHEGSLSEVSTLGAKGANLCHIERLGIEVPNGFIINVDTATDFLNINHTLSDIDYFIDEKSWPAGLEKDICDAIGRLEESTLTSFGGIATSNSFPLLLSVRSSPPVEIPGMLDAILNIGINDSTVESISIATGDRRFALDIQFHFLQLFGMHVLKIDKKKFDNIIEKEMKAREIQSLPGLTEDALATIISEFKKLASFPQDPFVQLKMSIEALYCSWYAPKVVKYRKISDIQADIGIGVIIQEMVYGNFNSFSGTGVAFSRNPTTGVKGLYGEFLNRAEGDDVIRAMNTISLENLKDNQFMPFDALVRAVKTLEANYKDMIEVEFTIEDKELYILGCMPARRTPQAAIRCAVDMVNEAIITKREAILKVDAKDIESYSRMEIDPDEKCDDRLIGIGLAASSGAVTGHAVFTSADAEAYQALGKPCILIKNITSTDDLFGIYAAAGVLTMRGGLTSYAAEECRKQNKCVVVDAGLSGLYINEANDAVCHNGTVCIAKDQVISLDSSGKIILGAIKTVESSHEREYLKIVKWADKFRRMRIFSTIRSVSDALKVKALEPDGVGEIILEDLVLIPERINCFRSLFVADTADERKKYREMIEGFMKEDLKQIYLQMHQMWFTVKLMDIPMKNIFPDDYNEMKELANKLEPDSQNCFSKITMLHESSPDVGIQGIRLALLHPKLLEMQMRAIFCAVGEVQAHLRETNPTMSFPPVHILLPMISTDHEVEIVSDHVAKVSGALTKEGRVHVPYNIGLTMEVPRACLRADSLASEGGVSFIQFDTEALTKFVYGISRVESSKLMSTYRFNCLFKNDPFETIDKRGVGTLVANAKDLIRRTNTYIRIGVSGSTDNSTHCSDRESVCFFEHLGLDYISCDPAHINSVKLLAAQAAISEQNKSIFN